MLLGVDVTAGGFVTRVGFEPVGLVVVIVACVSYAVGVRRYKKASGNEAADDRDQLPPRVWPVGRSLSWATGCLLVAVPMLSGMASWDASSMTIHGVTDSCVAMLAPIAFAFGAPMTLARATGGPRIRRLATSLMEGRAGRVASNFVLDWALWSATLFGQYMTSYYGVFRGSEVWLQLGEVEFLIAGLLFMWPVIGADRTATRVSAGWRMAWFFVGLPYYAIFGMTALSVEATHMAGVSLASFHSGADVVWSTGTVISLAGAAAVVIWAANTDLSKAREEDQLDEDALDMQAAVWRVGRILAKPEAVRDAEREAVARRDTITASTAGASGSAAGPALGAGGGGGSGSAGGGNGAGGAGGGGDSRSLSAGGSTEDSAKDSAENSGKKDS